ncbi:hypothetical protein BBF96_08130 [Anoxybacter fermentans]|uniref:Radical SAM core domain-containing protein n=1 Tax=Anoxybacter fermentans TaxID=1323375 RepID=A0A3Q9HQM5_9FIRM|nr:radical SAM protein [Anoxybacter fermentans]AZR73352.1 hypothetical protein BBF96_08130 [Anoxybacter fermentans]
MFVPKKIIYKKSFDGNYLVINSTTGMIDIMEEELVKVLRECDEEKLSQLDSTLLKKLEDRGYIFPSEEAYKKLYRDIYEKFASQKQPKIFAICPTYSCNLKCTYCYEEDVIDKKSDLKMSTEMIDKVFEAINEISNSPKYVESSENVFYLYGGEPLMPENKYLVEYIFEKMKQIDKKIEILTNGTTIKKYIDLFEKYRDQLFQIQISLDGIEEVHDYRRPFKNGKGTFKEIVENVELLLSKNFKVVLRVNVDEENLDLRTVYDFIKDMGWKNNINFMSIFSRVMCPKTFKHKVSENKFLKEVNEIFKYDNSAKTTYMVRDIKLLAHISTVLESGKLDMNVPPLFNYCDSTDGRYFAFCPDGKIYPCDQSVGIDELAIGTFTDGLQIDFEKYLKWRNRKTINMEKCRNCEIELFCGGGCALASWVANNDIYQPSCEGYKETINEYLEDLIERRMI